MGNSANNKPLRLAAALSLCGLTLAAVSIASVVSAAPPARTKKPAASSEALASTQPGFTDNTPLTEDQKILHLLNRAEFGPRPGDFEQVKRMGIDAWIDQQLHPQSIDDSAVEAKLASFTSLRESGQDLAQAYDSERKLNKERKVLLAQIQRQQEQSGATMTPDQSAAANAALKGGKKNLNALAGEMTPQEQEQLKQIQQAQRREGRFSGPTDLVVSKVVRAVDSPRQLQEVLVDFWTNHFNIDIRKNACRVYKISDDRDVIRPHALGRFRDLLEASAKSPAMLVYLDNFQSSGPQTPNPLAERAIARYRQRLEQQAAAGNSDAQLRLTLLKNRPKAGAQGLNENYAREIMELHTLGVDGGYTQKDVTEVARCLTGWTIDRGAYNRPAGAMGAMNEMSDTSGGFRFDPRRHDTGQKVVLGHVIPAGGGIEDGEKVLDILCSSPATMRHVSTQLCQRFVSDTPPASLVDQCVATWKRTEGDISQIVRTILTSREFNSRAAYQQKIKSPFEYAVSAARALGGTYILPDEGATALRPYAEGIALQANRAYNGGTNGRFLPGQVAVLGEPLFQCQPPTGYPEDSRKWVSSGALIARLNYALALTGGKLMDIQLPSAAATGGASGASPVQQVNQLTATILHGEVSPATRATLLREAAQMAPGPQNVAYTQGGAPPADPQTAAKLTALVLGSPEFQRR